MSTDKRRYRVAEAPHSIDHNAPVIIGRRAAFNAAMTLGERIVVYRRDGRARHWELIIDRSISVEGQLPKREHLRRVLGVCTAESMQRELGCWRHGRKGTMRWAPGYVVDDCYPPVSRKEAFETAREKHGANALVIFS